MNENNLQIFKNTEFGELGILIIEGKEYFPATQCARILGYSNPYDAIQKHCKAEGIAKCEGVSYTTNQYGVTSKQTNDIKYISEGNLYRLITRSKLPAADRFESWIFDEVLPTIRKTGTYSILAKPDSYMIDDPVERAKRWIEEYEEKKALETKIEEQKPLVDFATQVSDTTGLVDVGAFAKMCRKKGLDIGRNKLFIWLRERKYLRDNNEPYQSYINSGYFVVKEYTYLKNGEPQIGQKTYLTGKGQQYIYNKLAEV